MNEQAIILFFLIIGTGITLFLYMWTAKKEMNYRKDERWQLIQNKASRVANYSNNILILILAVGIFLDLDITLPLNRVLIYGIFFISFHNAIELFALIYFDKRL